MHVSGKTGLVVRESVLERPLLYLSLYFKQHREDYEGARRTIANLDDANKAITVRHLLDIGLAWQEGLRAPTKFNVA